MCLQSIRSKSCTLCFRATGREAAVAASRFLCLSILSLFLRCHDAIHRLCITFSERHIYSIFGIHEFGPWKWLWKTEGEEMNCASHFDARASVVSRGEKVSSFLYYIWKMEICSFKRKNQILLPLCFEHKHAISFKTPKSQADQEEECGVINWKVHWAAGCSRWTFSCLFHNCSVNLLEQFSLEGKKKALLTVVCTAHTFIHLPIHLSCIAINQ